MAMTVTVPAAAYPGGVQPGDLVKVVLAPGAGASRVPVLAVQVLDGGRLRLELDADRPDRAGRVQPGPVEGAVWVAR